MGAGDARRPAPGLAGRTGGLQRGAPADRRAERGCRCPLGPAAGRERVAGGGARGKWTIDLGDSGIGRK